MMIRGFAAPWASTGPSVANPTIDIPPHFKACRREHRGFMPEEGITGASLSLFSFQVFITSFIRSEIPGPVHQGILGRDLLFGSWNSVHIYEKFLMMSRGKSKKDAT